MNNNLIGITGLSLIIVSAIVFLSEEWSLLSNLKFIFYSFGISFLTGIAQKLNIKEKKEK